MLSNMIKVCERVKRPHRTPSILIQHASWLVECISCSVSLHEAQDPDRMWT
jgi:hypothetical protein